MGGNDGGISRAAELILRDGRKKVILPNDEMWGVCTVS